MKKAIMLILILLISSVSAAFVNINNNQIEWRFGQLAVNNDDLYLKVKSLVEKDPNFRIINEKCNIYSLKNNYNFTAKEAQAAYTLCVHSYVSDESIKSQIEEAIKAKVGSEITLGSEDNFFKSELFLKNFKSIKVPIKEAIKSKTSEKISAKAGEEIKEKIEAKDHLDEKIKKLEQEISILNRKIDYLINLLAKTNIISQTERKIIFTRFPINFDANETSAKAGYKSGAKVREEISGKASAKVGEKIDEKIDSTDVAGKLGRKIKAGELRVENKISDQIKNSIEAKYAEKISANEIKLNYNNHKIALVCTGCNFEKIDGKYLIKAGDKYYAISDDLISNNFSEIDFKFANGNLTANAYKITSSFLGLFTNKELVQSYEIK